MWSGGQHFFETLIIEQTFNENKILKPFTEVLQGERKHTRTGIKKPFIFELPKIFVQLLTALPV
jgi:hypothetical protein